MFSHLQGVTKDCSAKSMGHPMKIVVLKQYPPFRTSDLKESPKFEKQVQYILVMNSFWHLMDVLIFS